MYALILSRNWLASQVHGPQAASLPQRVMSASYKLSWSFVLTTVVAALSLLVKRSSSAKESRAGPSDQMLSRMVLLDCFLGPQHVFAVIEYLTKSDVECIAGASFAACMLNVYWPTTHISFICKWTGSGYPPRVVFAPELFRNLGFFCATIAAVAARDGSAAASAPAFLATLALRTAASFTLTMLAVTVTTAPLHVAVIENALPDGLLDVTCPRLLRGARDTVCSAMLAICAALHLQPQKLGNIAGLASTSADFTKSEAVLPGASFTGVAALSVVINIINADVSLHAIGRMQGLLTVAVIALMLSSPHGVIELVLPPPPAENLVDTEHLHLSWGDVVRGEVLGTGGFGSVHAARWRGTDVAIKFWVSKLYDETDEEGEQRLIHEAAVLMRLRHPNILQIFGVLPRPRAIVMERGVQTLAAMLKEQPWLPWTRCMELIRGIAAGTEFLHTHTPPIIHGDLKPSNILITASGTPKIADFGTSFLSRAAEAVREGSFMIWSPGYAPPEVLSRQPILIPEAVDVFAFGVIITAIVGGPKAQARSTSSLERATERSTRTGSTSSPPNFMQTLMQAYAIATYKPFMLLNCPDPLAAVVRACCCPSPEDRPSFIMLRGMLDEAGASVDSWPRRPT